MTKLIVLLAALATVAGLAYADPDLPNIAVMAASTNSAPAITTNSTEHFVSGWVDAIIVDMGGTSGSSCDVDVATAGSEYTGAARTIFSINDITADGVYPVRDLATTTLGVDVSGETVAIPLFRDTLKAWASNAHTTGITVRVYAIIKHSP